MKVCLVSNQVAAFGKIGGFGTATRAIASGLKRRGVEVCAVVVRRAGQARVEVVDGVTVHGMSPWATFTSGRVFEKIGADVYHSQEPTLATWHAQRAVPRAVHVVTCRDPRALRDHAQEWWYASASMRARFPATWLYEVSPLVRGAVRRASRVFCAAPCLRPLVRGLYGVDATFLPSPIRLPAATPRKAARPTVLMVGRFDRRKRVELFIDLARAHPAVRFVAVGRSHDSAYDRKLRRRMAGVANLEAPGFLSVFDPEALPRLYGAAWILANTSVREGLPYTFLEASAHGCAILSALDPDGFASRFGMAVEEGRWSDGLHALLEGDAWRARGEAGRAYVAETFGEERALDAHLAAYEEALARRA
jgi:glycosyltransferase involved in cell wall biosynthesis